tara:strand:+ start:179 stop:1171 length:993 start_codon:yes stop_codon:yes gene_type:complete
MQNNDTVWENTNGQAVLWYFNNCQMFYNETVFKNPGTFLFVNGGDYINPGIFYHCEGISQLGGQFFVDGARFENYQNLDPSKSPVWMKLETGSYQEIVWRNVSNVGGGDISAKTVFDLAGTFDISFYNCNQRGKMVIDANTSVGGLMSRVSFHDCPLTAPITQTLQGAQGNRPVSVIYDRSGFLSRYARVTRDFVKSVYNSPTSAGSKVSQQDVQTQFTLNASSGSVEVPIESVDPYSVVVIGARIIHTRNGGSNYTINLWEDNTKTNLIFTKLITNDSNLKRITTIGDSDMNQLRDITATSPSLLLEFEAAGSSGTITANTYLEIATRV